MDLLSYDPWDQQPQPTGFPEWPSPDYPSNPPPGTDPGVLPTIAVYTFLAIGTGFIVVAVPKGLQLIYRSLLFVRKNANLKYLIHEEKGVEGCGFFGKVMNTKKRFDWYHCFGKVSRMSIAFLFAPFFIVPIDFERTWGAFKAIWFLEKARPHKAVLSTAPGGGGSARFHPTGYRPTFLVRAWPKDNGEIGWEQIRNPLNHTIRYTAISYSFDGARPLCGLSDSNNSSSTGRRYTLAERRYVAVAVLDLYARTLHPPMLDRSTVPTWTEYVWIDELCLSEGPRVDHSKEHNEIRDKELGRLADIFSRADNVVVFCNKPECDHISLNCPWNGRLFTIPEIFGARKVTLMIKSQSGQFRLDHQPGHHLRRGIQNSAELRNDALHLHAVMKHSPDPVDNQQTIHSLIVEALRRDDIGNFVNHNMLGRGLNGLFARRARLEDVPGRDGWADLCWLLELNQGHFNAATLAAVCSLDAGSDRNTDMPLRHPWLGRPVLPEPGTERLEPLVTAIPVVNPDPSQNAASALNIVGPKIIGVPPFPRRDSLALYAHKDLKGLLLLTYIVLPIVCVYNLHAVVASGASAWRVWFSFFVVGASRLVAETTCLRCEDWVHLDVETWGNNPSLKLGELDCRLREMVEWGDPDQPLPKWHVPSDSHAANMVDLANGIFTRCQALRKPNAILPLAVHGSGITSMLLDRPEEFNLDSERVGMVNLPPYILSQAKRAASVVIGGKVKREPKESWLDKVRHMGTRIMDWKKRGYIRLEEQPAAQGANGSA